MQKKNSWFYKPLYKKEYLNQKTDPYITCEACSTNINEESFKKNFYVCLICNHHKRISSELRIQLLTDSFEESFTEITARDPLNFVADNQLYKDKCKKIMLKEKKKESVICGTAKIKDLVFELIVMDFSFLGGSLGSATGEKIILTINRSIENSRGLVIVGNSGGARMQEGIFSLMQMSRILTRLYDFSEKKLPYISILTDPTMGGVTASFSSLGDIILAEPNALIGFAGPRVIEKTISKVLPKGFQRSEFLKKRGFIDRIIERRFLKNEIEFFLRFFDGN